MSALAGAEVALAGLGVAAGVYLGKAVGDIAVGIVKDIAIEAALECCCCLC